MAALAELAAAAAWLVKQSSDSAITRKPIPPCSERGKAFIVQITSFKNINVKALVRQLRRIAYTGTPKQQTATCRRTIRSCHDLNSTTQRFIHVFVKNCGNESNNALSLLVCIMARSNT